MAEELAKWQEAADPADPRSVAVLLEETLELYGVPKNWEGVAGFYLEAFEDVPLDLVRSALKSVRLTCKFFPKPSELRAPIRDDLNERNQSVLRLGAMLQVGHFPDDDEGHVYQPLAELPPDLEAKRRELKGLDG